MLLGKSCFDGSYPTLKKYHDGGKAFPFNSRNMQNHVVHLFVGHLSNDTDDIPTSIVFIEFPFSLINPKNIFKVHLDL